MSSTSAILICDRDHHFREALRNFLLAKGCARIEVVAHVREALTMLRGRRFAYVLIGMARPRGLVKRLATVATCRQPQAKIICFGEANELVEMKGLPGECLLKEYLFATLMEVMR